MLSCDEVYKVEVQLPVNKLSETEREYLEVILSEELVMRKKYSSNKSFFVSYNPQAKVSDSGLIKFDYNHGTTDRNFNPSPRISHQDAYVIVKGCLERLFITDGITLPRITFDNRYAALIQEAIPEDRALRYIKTHPDKFNQSGFWDRLFDKKGCQVRNIQYAKRLICQEEFKRSMSANIMNLKSFSHALLPLADNMKRAMADLDMDNRYVSVRSITVPFSFTQTISIKLNEYDVEVWFSNRMNGGVPVEVSLRWLESAGKAYTLSLTMDRAYYLADPVGGVEINFHCGMEILAIKDDVCLEVTPKDKKLMEYLLTQRT